MPRRDDLKKILLIGSGPIVIGQACEFDYSGTQGAKALAAEGYEVILVNSNPATIMTDPELAYRTYVEPLDVPSLTAILERDRPDAILPTLGGQTALNLALALDDQGVLDRLGIELIGASPAAIRKAEDRQLFKQAMESIGLDCPRAGHARSVEEARAIAETEGSWGPPTGYPVIVRPSFTLGGSGGGIAYRPEELEAKVRWALEQSPTHEVLIEQSVLGWKEFELEVIRDRADNFIVVCTIENIDPMGVHTGDSITCAPSMTLTDREYQRLRNAARAVMSEIGVETGGSNVQFAVNPEDGRVVVIEMNPRVSRSSALASKATGYPIAKIAAKLAVGYRLDELTNDITGTSAAFEPTIDYVVVKWPRFAFEKFPGADRRLGPQMKSVGEVMSIGRTFPEALQKAARSLETGRDGLATLIGKVDYRQLGSDPNSTRDMLMDAPDEPKAPTELPPPSPEELVDALRKVVGAGSSDRLFYVADAVRAGIPLSELHELTRIDPWFLSQIERIVSFESKLSAARGSTDALSTELLRDGKRLGFSDRAIGRLTGLGEDEVRAARIARGIAPVFGRVDTCAAEFTAKTPYLYSTYESESEAAPSARRKVVILGGGPNRIGQGIEFDYCCVHAAFALRDLGFETVMVNCNPETVSTDYDTSDRLYFEPLTFEDVLAICEEERKDGELVGVVVQYGGQTPLKLAVPLARAGVPLLGTSADAIDRAEDRGRFDELLTKLGLRRPRAAVASSVEEALAAAKSIGYPVLVRPSYVLGGRAMMICHEERELEAYIHPAVEAAREAGTQSILIDEFLKDAIEVDVDAIGDGRQMVICGVMQHIEEAGVHSGDSSCVLPPHSLSPEVVASIEEQARQLGLELGVVGLMNVQFALKGSTIYVLEVNPRASRTVPFVSKATGRPLAKIAVQVMAGKTLAELGITEAPTPAHVAVKESVFPFAKFPGVDTQLGPEMRSTGEVMGVAATFAHAFGKALRATGMQLPTGGCAFISVKDDDKPAACVIARRLRALGFAILATEGTAAALQRARIPATSIRKVNEGSPHVVDAIKAGQVSLVVNTTVGARSIRDSYPIRRNALLANIPYFTTMAAAMAATDVLEASAGDARATYGVRSLQEWHDLG
ncbi:carbamoyl-phosphate synthase large subunit [Polyangium aurulentum]|uniref:carbamoyl-phosphate synthase large subunit n=1 Tax=Polyangium aurulentum TaxID=2567896 RepID=UPI0010AE2CE2|nr:carbamoyl-phosphate synthase large subunit [Polyangium aurulentum]UQA62307.1 carbamoyl-phosphate synthase large subunit [Polyangium aurulentum]